MGLPNSHGQEEQDDNGESHKVFYPRFRQESRSKTGGKINMKMKGFTMVPSDVAPSIGEAATLGQMNQSAGLGANPANPTEALKVTLGNPAKQPIPAATATPPPQDRIGRYGPGGISQ